MLKLDKNEKLIAIFRKHIFYFLTEIGGLVLVAIIPFVFYPFLKSFISSDFSPQSIYFFLFIYFIFLTILWNVGFILWTDYYLDMWILTDKRLIDVEQKGLFAREVSSMRLDRIQDIKLEVSGLIQTFLNMGSVQIQTAGDEQEFVFYNAKNPTQIKDLVLNEHNNKMEEIKTVRVEHTTESTTSL